MIVKLQNGDKLKIESDEKREARRKYKEHSQLSIGQKLKRNLNIASNFLKSGPNITNFGNVVSALFGGFNPENPDVTKGDPPAIGIKNFENLVRTARVAREFNDVVKGPVNQFKLLNNFIEKFVTNPKGSGKLVHYDKGNGKSVYQKNRGASIINGKLIPGKTKREGQKDYTWWNTDNPYMNVHKAKDGPLSPTRYIVVDGNTQFQHPFDLKEPVGQSAGKGRGFILSTERVTDKPVDLTNAEIYEKSPFGWWERIKVQPTPEVTKSKQSRLISPNTYPLYRGPRFDINEIVNFDGTVNPRKAMQAQHTVAKQFGKGAHKMEHRLENLEWHKEDPNTYEHTKRVAQSAWRIPTPEGYTKQDQMIAALGHDFGKIVSGDGHAQIGADLAKQVFIGIKPHQLQAIREHMDQPTTRLGEVTKAADILNGRDFNYLQQVSPELYNKVFRRPEESKHILKMNSNIENELTYSIPLYYPEMFTKPYIASEETKSIINNIVFPRLQQNRPDINVGENFDFGNIYKLPWQMFEKAGEKSEGFFNKKTGKIVRKDYSNYYTNDELDSHELRHRIASQYPYTKEEQNIVKEAFENFNDANINKVEKNYPIEEEIPTTINDARNRLLSTNNDLLIEGHWASPGKYIEDSGTQWYNLSLEDQNRLINEASPSEIIYSYHSGNNYGRNLIEYLENNNLLNQDRIEKLRKALFIGSTIPFLIPRKEEKK